MAREPSEDTRFALLISCTVPPEIIKCKLQSDHHLQGHCAVARKLLRATPNSDEFLAPQQIVMKMP